MAFAFLAPTQFSLVTLVRTASLEAGVPFVSVEVRVLSMLKANPWPALSARDHEILFNAQTVEELDALLTPVARSFLIDAVGSLPEFQAIGPIDIGEPMSKVSARVLAGLESLQRGLARLVEEAGLDQGLSNGLFSAIQGLSGPFQGLITGPYILSGCAWMSRKAVEILMEVLNTTKLLQPTNPATTITALQTVFEGSYAPPPTPKERLCNLARPPEKGGCGILSPLIWESHCQ